MATTQKMIDVLDPIHGDRLLAVYDKREKFNPYVLYVKWYDCGWHRRKITKCADIVNAMRFITDILNGTIHI